MKFMNAAILIAGLSALLYGCAGGSGDPEKNRLTPTEEQIVISHVRRFVQQSRKIRLSENERRIIQTANPSLSIHYTGYKAGRLSIRWALPGYRVLLLQRSGHLLSSEKADWTVRIISDRTSGKIPSNFYGAHGEDISLPPR